MLRAALPALLIALALTALAPAALAQPSPSPIAQGGSFFTGTFNLANQGGDFVEMEGEEGLEGRRTTFVMDLSGGAFVAQGFALGGLFLGQLQSQDGITVSTFGLGPEVSYFFKLPYQDIYPSIAVAGILSSVTVNQGDFEASENGFAFQASAGATFMLGRQVGVTVEGYYLAERLNQEDDDALQGDTLGVRGGLTIFLF
ncbi:MAG: hypothetical protein AAGF99_04735 [Bacteroidota bacterium]